MAKARPLTFEPIDFTLKEDIGTDNPTTFHLRPLTSKMMEIVRDSTARQSQSSKQADDAGSLSFLLGTREKLLVKFGLIGWNNLEGLEFDEKQHTEWNGMLQANVLKDRTLERLWPAHKAQLAAKVDEISDLSEADEKNSDGRLKTSSAPQKASSPLTLMNEQASSASSPTKTLPMQATPAEG